MLKKTGLVVATATMSMLALSPLAFAGDKSSDHHGGKDDKSHSMTDKKDHDGKKSDDGKKVEKDNISNDCEFGNESGDAEQGIFGGTGLLGAADLVTGTVTNAATQTNTLNCTNVNVTDVIDVDSNNETSAEEQAFIDRSFNDEN